MGNNLKALLTHIGMGFIVWAVFYPFHNNFMIPVRKPELNIFVILVVLSVYIFVGSKLKNLGSVIKNLLSPVSPAYTG